jgi:hypothetical protein
MTLLLTFQTGPGVRPVGIKGVFTGVKRPGLHPFPRSVEVENGWSYTYAPSCALAAWTRPTFPSCVWKELGMRVREGTAPNSSSSSTQRAVGRSAAEHSVKHFQKTDRHFSFLMLPECGKNIAFVKVPRLRPFVLITKATFS